VSDFKAKMHEIQFQKAPNMLVEASYKAPDNTQVRQGAPWKTRLIKVKNTGDHEPHFPEQNLNMPSFLACY